jgi:hypothetical protein
MWGIIITKTTTLTQEKITEIAGYIRAGNFANVACQLVGVPERTYYHWRDLGKEPGNGIYSEFYEAIETAKAELEAHLVEHLVTSDRISDRGVKTIIYAKRNASCVGLIIMSRFHVVPPRRHLSLLRLRIPRRHFC